MDLDQHIPQNTLGFSTIVACGSWTKWGQHEATKQPLSEWPTNKLLTIQWVNMKESGFRRTPSYNSSSNVVFNGNMYPLAELAHMSLEKKSVRD